MKVLSFIPSVCAVLGMNSAWSHAANPNTNAANPNTKPFPGNSGNPGNKPPPGHQVPKPGNCKKTTRVDFKNQNNGWGNGDQDPPGNSGDHNNAENSNRQAPPGIIKKDSPAAAVSTSDKPVARRVK